MNTTHDHETHAYEMNMTILEGHDCGARLSSRVYAAYIFASNYVAIQQEYQDEQFAKLFKRSA